MERGPVMRYWPLFLFGALILAESRPGRSLVGTVLPSHPFPRVLPLPVSPPCEPSPAFAFDPGPPIIGPPMRSSPPVLADVLCRLPDPEYWRDQTDPFDLVTWTHEGTHGACVRLPRRPGCHSIYCLEGRSVTIRHPRLTIGQVAAAIPVEERGQIFQLYMVDQRRDWDREPIYLVEEWTAYIHGTFARRQLGLVERQETERHAAEMERYCRAILALAARVDPDYPDAAKLAAFIEWNAARFRSAIE